MKLPARYSVALAVCIMWTALGCDKSKKEVDASPATTPAVITSVAAVKTAPVSLLTRPTTQPGIIQPGDWIRVVVDEVTGPGKPMITISRITADGTADLPYVGSISLTGATNGEAQRKIAEAFKNAMVLSDPHVAVQRICLSHPGDPLPAPIQKYDLVRIDVMDLRALGARDTLIMRVTADGTIVPPYLSAMKIASLTDANAASAIAAQYKKAQLISNPNVKVTTLETAPPNAEHLDLPDGPIYPVPEVLKSLFTE